MNTHEQLINADAYVIVSSTNKTTGYICEAVVKSTIELSTAAMPYFLSEDNMLGVAGRRMGKVITSPELLGAAEAMLLVPRDKFGDIAGKGEVVTEKVLEDIDEITKHLPQTGKTKAHFITYEEYMASSSLHVLTLPHGKTVEEIDASNPKDMGILRAMLASRQGGFVGDTLFYYTNDYVEQTRNQDELRMLEDMITKLFGTMLSLEVLRNEQIHAFLFDIPERGGSTHNFGHTDVKVLFHAPPSVDLANNTALIEYLKQDVIATILQLFAMRRTTVLATPTTKISELRDVAMNVTDRMVQLRLIRSGAEDNKDAGVRVEFTIPISFEYSSEENENVATRLGVFFDVMSSLTSEMMLTVQERLSLPVPLTVLYFGVEKFVQNGDADDVVSRDEAKELEALFENSSDYHLFGTLSTTNKTNNKLLRYMINANFLYTGKTKLSLVEREEDMVYAVKGDEQIDAMKNITSALQIAENRSYINYVVSRFANEEKVKDDLAFLMQKDLMAITKKERYKLKLFLKMLVASGWKEELNSPALPVNDFKPSRLGDKYTAFHDRKSPRAFDAINAFLEISINKPSIINTEEENIIVQEVKLGEWKFSSVIELVAIMNLLVRPFAFASCDKEGKVLELGYLAIEEDGEIKFLQYAVVHRNNLTTMDAPNYFDQERISELFESDNAFDLVTAMFSFVDMILGTTKCDVHVFATK